MNVEVKCPKCRYRFLVAATFGESQLSCVCERCGTPFTFQLDRPEEEAPVSSPSSSSSAVVPPPIPPSADDHAGKGETSVPPPVPPAYQRESVIGAQAALRQERRQFEDAARHPDQQVGGWAKGCIIAFVALVLAIGYGGYRLIHHFSGDRFRDQASIETPRNPISSSGDDTADTMSAKGDEDQFEEIHQQDPPGWIEGSWYGTASYGEITMRLDIDQRQLSISVGSKPVKSGSFYYKDGVLNCDYNDGSTKQYTVNAARHAIVTGDGVELHQ